MTPYEQFCTATGAHPARYKFEQALDEEIEAGWGVQTLIRAFNNPRYEINSDNVLAFRGSILWAQLLGQEYRRA